MSCDRMFHTPSGRDWASSSAPAKASAAPAAEKATSVDPTRDLRRPVMRRLLLLGHPSRGWDHGLWKRYAIVEPTFHHLVARVRPPDHANRRIRVPRIRRRVVEVRDDLE